jgi:hypothetical protein
MKVADYLRNTDDYLSCPPGLRWVNSGEAIELINGQTFALRQEIALFLEGFGSVRPLLPFAMMLHLLALVGQETARSCREVETLQSMFRLHNRPLRNAGVLCAHLCAAVPDPGDLVEVDEVRLHLQSGPLMTVLMCRWRNQQQPAVSEVPIYRPEELEQQVIRELRGYTLKELKHWLQHGWGPIDHAAEEIAREMRTVPPRTLGDVFSHVAHRGRVAAVLPFVDQMVSALALPPRRLEHQELPLGGYADLSTRGQPEQILFSQLALDEMEFVRRFAEKELLYFRREEPHKQTRQELLVILDQGVRTWGEVRLLLTAAVFAFARLAQARKMPFRLTGTSISGVLDPLAAEERALGDLLEASDLSLNPGLALERALEEPATQPRELLLLTHPRNLMEEDVRTAAKRLKPGTRLFAVTADERGDVKLSELRQGTALAMTRFHVELSPSRNEPPRAARLLDTADLPSWTGDVEPISFPFGGYQIPPDWGTVDLRFDFDLAGEWLLVCGHEGMLQAYRVGGNGRPVTAILPRGLFEDEILHKVDRVLGVAGGFVVGGTINSATVLAHYDFGKQQVKVYKLLNGSGLVDYWHYDPARHSPVLVTHASAPPQTPVWVAVDLSTGEVAVANQGHTNSNRAGSAGDATFQRRWRPPHLHMVVCKNAKDQFRLSEQDRPCVYYIEKEGSFRVEIPDRAWDFFRLQSDSRPTFQVGAPLRAIYQHDTLVVGSIDRVALPILAAFRAPEGKCLGVFPIASSHAPFALSTDGRLLAVQGKMKGVVVRDLNQDGRVILSTRYQRHLSELQVELAERSMIVRTNKRAHLFRWGEATFHSESRPNSGPLMERWKVSGETPKRWAALPTTSWRKLLEIAQKVGPVVGMDNPSLRLRFLRRARTTILVGVDPFGHLAIFDAQGQLVCLFYFRGHTWSVWMPDGTTYRYSGSGSAKADILDRLAHALNRASDLGGGVRS